MGGIIPEQTIEEIRARNDIVDTIGSYIPLKRAGANFKALCPFHKEKTPSFHVNPQRQSYHCFGCGAGGDVFKFVMEREAVDFVNASRMLARRAGIEIEFTESDGEAASGKDALYRVHEDLALMYHRALLETEGGGKARRYLQERELGEQIIKDFLLGYAPERRDALVLWARKKGCSLEVMERAGLLTRNEERGDYYDRFQGRLMFPIRDEIGRIVAFSGRLLDPEAHPAKYVNSPETPLFRKSRILYGLDRARKPMVEARRAVICEGQIDTIRCHAAGIHTAVAPQGTALTEEHARLLQRYADEIVLVFDADSAGQKAALRSGEICLGSGLSVLVATLPPGEDPDSLIRGQGAPAFEALLAAARPLVHYQIEMLSQQERFEAEAGLMRAAKAVLQTIAAAPGAVQRDKMLEQAAPKLGLTEDALRREMAHVLRRRHAGARQEVAAPPPADSSPPREEIELAHLLVQHADIAPLIRQFLPPERLTHADCRAIVAAALSRPDSAGPGFLSAIRDAGDDCIRLAARFQTVAMVFDEEFTPERKAQELILRIRCKHVENEKRNLIRKLESMPASDDRRRLESEGSHLTMELTRLRQGWTDALPILRIS